MTHLITMPENYDNIRSGIVELLQAARSAAARNVNSIMTATYWEIGRRIVTLEQGGSTVLNTVSSLSNSSRGI
jgi:hypothetical protein